jgi:hypothetical protein
MILAAGRWEIQVTVINAAGLSIGSASAEAVITGGETTLFQIPVRIDVTGNDITSFIITSPVQAAGEINENGITVRVPAGTNITNMTASVIHTGKALLVPTPGQRGGVDFSTPQSYTVTAENGSDKIYLVTAAFEVPSIPGGGSRSWPGDDVWTKCGLSGLTRPSGATVDIAGISSGSFIVSLSNAVTSADFTAFISAIETIRSATGTTSTNSGYPEYVLPYLYGGDGFTLTLYFISDQMILNIEPDNTSLFVSWPSTAKWAEYGIPGGLPMPSGAVLDDVIEGAHEGIAILTVTLSGAAESDYVALLNQLTTKLGSPLVTNGAAGDPDREAVWASVTDLINEKGITLAWDRGTGKIIILAAH